MPDKALHSPLVILAELLSNNGAWQMNGRLRPVLVIGIFLLGFRSGALAADKAGLFDQNTFKNFKIISADKLRNQDNSTWLSGNVKIRFGEYEISAPQVTVEPDKRQPASKLIRFSDGVTLISKSLKVESQIMELDTQNNLFKCFSEDKDNSMVRTVLSKEPEKQSEKQFDDEITIISQYQDYNYETKVATARGNVEYISQDRNINADMAEMRYAKKQERKSGLDFVNFRDNVVLTESDKRVEADELLYFPGQELVKALSNVRILFQNSDQENGSGLTYLFADLAVLEQSPRIFSAYSIETDKPIHIYTDEMIGRGRQLLVKQMDKKIDKAVLTGNAYAQYRDKAVIGEEVLFDIKNKVVKTLVGRPKTLILTSEMR